MDPSKILITKAGAAAVAKRPAPPKKATAKAGGTKKRLPAAERRQQLIDVAREVFLNVGRDGVSTHQIADAAGVNVALLYQHFNSSVELFDVAVLQPLEQVLTDRVAAAVDTLPVPDGEPRQALAEMHRALLELLVETAPMLSIALFGDQEAGREFWRDRIEPLLENWLAATYGRLKGRHRPADPMTVAKAVFGIHLTQALYAHMLGVQLDIPSVSRDISDFVYLGFFDPAASASA
ncbi:MAG: TetR/AcrR family transcriptional regulator [Actinomycetota bacterium]|jgi:AcrR family transcriptional regulator